MSNQFKVSNLWAQRLQEHHISLPAVLRRAGLPAGFFQQETIYVTTAELFALWRAVGETSGDPAIGLKLGAEARLERYDPAAIAAVCSRVVPLQPCFRSQLQANRGIAARLPDGAPKREEFSSRDVYRFLLEEPCR